METPDFPERLVQGLTWRLRRLRFAVTAGFRDTTAALINPLQRLRFLKEFYRFAAMSAGSTSRLSLRWKDCHAYLNDRTATSGFDHHYIYHCAWAARVLSETRPKHHVDISSQLPFCSIVSAFVPVEFYDYRPASLFLSGLKTGKADLCALDFASGSIESLSSMHVVEHMGLGRYGDPLDPDGDLKAISELKRVLASGGSLLFVVPIGKPRIIFNGHRIYSYRQICGYFADLELKQFALIPDNADETGIIYNAKEELADTQSYGCGCFWFKKR